MMNLENMTFEEFLKNRLGEEVYEKVSQYIKEGCKEGMTVEEFRGLVEAAFEKYNNGNLMGIDGCVFIPFVPPHQTQGQNK